MNWIRKIHNNINVMNKTRTDNVTPTCDLFDPREIEKYEHRFTE